MNKPKVTATKDAATSNTGRPSGAYNVYTDYMWLDGDWEVQNSAYQLSDKWVFNGGHEFTNSHSVATSAQMPFIIGFQCGRAMCQMKMVMDETGETGLYDMTDTSNNRFEYWNLGKGYPEVVLFENIDNNNYTMTISGGQVGTKQKDYFTKSGFVFRRDGSAVRTMKKK